MPDNAVTILDTVIALRWPWCLGALLLPILVRLLMRAAPVSEASLRLPHLVGVEPRDKRRFGWRRMRFALVCLAYLSLTLAAARPVMIGDETFVPRTGRDLMLVIDISGSMGQEDWGSGTTRMGVVKHVVGDFIKRRQGDRVGVVFFGSRAYLQTPLTFDLGSIQLQLNETSVGIAGPATALGDAIGLTIKHLRDSDVNHKVMVLISDGATNAGAVTADEAVTVATQFGLTVYTIGIGSVAHNNPEMGSFDAELLQSLAAKTGGQFFQARARSELESVYRALDTMEPATIESDIVRRETVLYPWPLAVALGLMLVMLIGEARSRRQSGEVSAWAT